MISIAIISIVIIFLSKFITSQLLLCSQVKHYSETVVFANQLMTSIDEVTKPLSQKIHGLITINPSLQVYKGYSNNLVLGNRTFEYFHSIPEIQEYH